MARNPASLACQIWGPPAQKKGKQKEKLAARRNFSFFLLEKEPENKLPVAGSPPDFPSGSDTRLEGGVRPCRGSQRAGGTAAGGLPAAPAEGDALLRPAPRLHPAPAPAPGRARLARPRLALSPLPLSVPAEHRSLAGSLGAPALCPR